MSITDAPKILMCGCGVGSRRREPSDLFIIAILLEHCPKIPQSTFANAGYYYYFYACRQPFLACPIAVSVGAQFSGDVSICSFPEKVWERTPKGTLYSSPSQERKFWPEMLPRSMRKESSKQGIELYKLFVY